MILHPHLVNLWLVFLSQVVAAQIILAKGFFFFSHRSNLVWDVWKFWGWSLATVCCCCCYTSPCKQTWIRAPRGLAKNRHTHEKYDFSVKISRCSSWNTNKNLQWRFNHGPFILTRKWRYKNSKALWTPISVGERMLLQHSQLVWVICWYDLNPS